MKREGFSFSFDPEKCAECKGRCCSNKTPSYLYINQNEIAEVASFLNISETQFKTGYLNRVNGLHNIKDIKINGVYHCVLLEIDSGKCSIYEARPKQCRDYPFWDLYKKDSSNLYIECPAVSPFPPLE